MPSMAPLTNRSKWVKYGLTGVVFGAAEAQNRALVLVCILLLHNLEVLPNVELRG